MKTQNFTTITKKIFSLIISLVILSNIFSFAVINNVNNMDFSNNCATDTITQCCNIFTVLPVKIVSNFLKDNLGKSYNFGYTKNSSDTENKKSNKKKEDKNLFHFAVFEKDFSGTQFYNSLTADTDINKYNSYMPVLSVLSFVMSFILMFIVFFKGSMILARGDTEDIIKIINIEKNIRLV